ncbi:hypothetical protein RhiJN_22526 [Ceratobasidium sp. AG-Ba]|nr:hypothetical protein RhiJN_22526 [Ceratobasidium sp. AG-Ba]
MTPRAGRPSHLKPVVSSRMPAVLAYQAESTAGLTPRTPYSFQPAEITAEDEEESLEVKVHPSPSAPITPAALDVRRHKYRSANHPDRSKSSARWRLVTWSAVVTLVVIVFLSLYNVDPRHVLLPQARSESVTDWIDIVSRKANGGIETSELVHETSTGGVMHPTRVMTSDAARITTR